MEFLYRVLEWLQRIIILYSCGEEAIPSQLKPLFERAKVEPDGVIKSDCLMCLDGDIDAVYQISDYTISESVEKSNNVHKVLFTIYESTNEYQTFSYEISNGVLYYFIPKSMMSNINSRSIKNFCKIVEMLYVTIIGMDHNTYGMYLAGKYIPLFLTRNIFINTTFNVDNYINKYISCISDDYLEKAIFEYLKKNIDFNNCNLTETLKEYIGKFESGDDELISGIATEYNKIKYESKDKLEKDDN